jgi:hypothetical protein
LPFLRLVTLAKDTEANCVRSAEISWLLHYRHLHGCASIIGLHYSDFDHFLPVEHEAKRSLLEPVPLTMQLHLTCIATAIAAVALVFESSQANAALILATENHRSSNHTKPWPSPRLCTLYGNETGQHSQHAYSSTEKTYVDKPSPEPTPSCTPTFEKHSDSELGTPQIARNISREADSALSYLQTAPAPGLAIDDSGYVVDPFFALSISKDGVQSHRKPGRTVTKEGTRSKTILKPHPLRRRHGHRPRNRNRGNSHTPYCENKNLGWGGAGKQTGGMGCANGTDVTSDADSGNGYPLNRYDGARSMTEGRIGSSDAIGAISGTETGIGSIASNGESSRAKTAKVSNRTQGFNYKGIDYAPGLTPINANGISETILVLNGLVDTDASFIYVPVDGVTTKLLVDVSVGDSSIATKATAMHRMVQDMNHNYAFVIHAYFSFGNQVGRTTFNLDVSSSQRGKGNSMYNGFLTCIGISIVDEATGTVLSGGNSDGVVIDYAKLNMSAHDGYNNVRGLTIHFQAPSHNPDGWTLSSFLAATTTVVRKGDTGESKEIVPDVLDYDSTSCNPLPSALRSPVGWDLGTSRCSLAISPRAIDSDSVADFLVQTRDFRAGSDVVTFSTPRFVVAGVSFKTTLKVTALGSPVPLLLLNETTQLEYDYFGNEVIVFHMKHTREPTQSENATAYYLALPNGRYASFEGDFMDLDTEEQSISFVTSQPGDEVATVVATISGTSGFVSSALCRLGNNSKLTVANNSPSGTVLLSSFAESDLAIQQGELGESLDFYVIRISLDLVGYTRRNFSEFKSEQIKQVLATGIAGKSVQNELSSVTSTASTFKLESVKEASSKVSTLRGQYATRLTVKQAGAGNGSEIVAKLTNLVSSGSLARSVRLRSTQILLADDIAVIQPRKLRVNDGPGSALSTGVVLAIALLSLVPILVLCVIVALFARRHSTGSLQHRRAPALPVDDRDGLFIDTDAARYASTAATGLGASFPADAEAEDPSARKAPVDTAQGA